MVETEHVQIGRLLCVEADLIKHSKSLYPDPIRSIVTERLEEMETSVVQGLSESVHHPV